MSYDISLVHEVEDIDVGNMTYNVSPMFSDALGHVFRDYDGKRAGDIIDELLAGIEKMTADPDRYKAKNPENGWGSYEGALAYLVRLYKACLEYPESIVRVY